MTVLELHNDYNAIYILQNELPSKRGKKDYSEIEFQIIEKAGKLKLKCFAIIQNLKSSKSIEILKEVENIYEGVTQIEKNPYYKVGGYRRLI